MLVSFPLHCTTAFGADYLAVVLDRTGSMQAIRANGHTRCEDALAYAKSDLKAFFARCPTGLAKVWSFRIPPGIQDLTGGYVNQAAAMAAMNGLSPTGCTGMTPLADAICTAADDFPGGLNYREMALSTDGGENSSVCQCSGPHSQSGPPPPGNYDAGSWQKKAWDTCLNNVVVNARDWFDPGGERGVDVETGETRGRGDVSDRVFFEDVADSTGGEYIPMPDDHQGVPTLSEWGMIIFTTLIIGIGAMTLVRRRMA